jgi:phosphate:Na+ symporter
VAMIDDLEAKIMFMLDLSIEYLEELKPEYTYKIIEMEGRINEKHHNLREEILVTIQTGNCDAVGGLNTIDFIDAMEVIGDKMKNLVKAGSHNFLYNEALKVIEADEGEDADLV